MLVFIKHVKQSQAATGGHSSLCLRLLKRGTVHGECVFESRLSSTMTCFSMGT